MNYYFTPPHTHYDFGLGFTASNFHDAAKLLKKSENELLDGVSPICFLHRHAIELFLKSLIYILHKKYRILFSEGFSLKNPAIRSKNGKYVSMSNTHDIAMLYERFSSLLLKAQHLLPTGVNWKIPENIQSKINLVSGTDPNSTYFRYPIATNVVQDSKKSRVQKINTEKLFERINESSTPVKTMIMLDAHDNIVESYDLNSKVLPEIQRALEDLCKFLHEFHCAFRGELTKGF